MNIIKKILEEMEEDLLMARSEKSVVSDRIGYVSGFIGGEIKTLEKYIQKILQSTPSEQEEMWISVKDETPEVGFYLVTVEEKVASKKRGLVEIGECYKSVNSDLKEITRFHDYVTHWMPLPKPPITP